MIALLRTAGFVRATLAVLLVFANVPAVRAIDPDRALTQTLLRKWQVQQGLPQATVLAVIQSSDGYLWLGTQLGLYRFDGLRFSAAPDEEEGVLASSWVQALTNDSKGRLWVATDAGGVICVDRSVVTAYGLDDGLPSLRIRSLCPDAQGGVWAGTAAGIARFDGRRWTPLSTSAGELPGDVRALAVLPDRGVWLAHDGNRLSRWDGTSLVNVPVLSLPAGESLTALAVDSSDSTLWIGSTAGLIRWRGGTEQRFTTVQGLADNVITCLSFGSGRTLWIGTRNGLCRPQKDRFESFGLQAGLSQSTVNSLSEDREGTLWVGTKHGLNQLVDRRTIPYTVSEGLPSNDAGPVIEDRQGRLWAGTLGAGLALFDGHAFQPFVPTESRLPHETIRAIIRGGGRGDDLIVGTDGGCCRIEGGRVAETWTTDDGLPAEEVTCLLHDPAGVLWAGTRRGLVEFRGGRFREPEGDVRWQRLPITALAVSGDGLLAGTMGGGLLQCVGGRLTPVAADQTLPRDIAALYRDAEGLLWLGTRDEGLFILDGQRVHRLTVRDGLYDEDIFGIIEDDAGRMWLAGSRGMFFVPRSDVVQFMHGKLERVTCRPFSTLDAMRTIECQRGVQPVVWRASDGRVWCATIMGLLVINPDHLLRDLPPPPVRIEELRVNGENRNPEQVGPVAAGPANLDFRYTALSFASPSRLKFRYQLEGFDPDWIEAQARREAFYTNLPPGDYRFQVAVAQADGPWYDTIATSTVSVPPRFYQSWWFWPLMAAALGATVWSVYVLRIRQLQLQMRAVLTERARIARELHDTLIQGFSGVTLQMQALVNRLRPSTEKSTLEEIIGDAGNCLQEARRSVAGLRSPRQNGSELATAVGEAARQLTETRGIRLEVKLAEASPRLAADVEYNLLRIAQEAIINAVRHSRGRMVEVVLECSDQELSLSVRDDGIGFVPPDAAHPLPGHYGLIGMQERAAQIRARLELRTAPGQGTTVRVVLPAAAMRAAAAAVTERGSWT